jgi:ubiquinone/menaquinone biosynthesis C-methylase UbiE
MTNQPSNKDEVNKGLRSVLKRPVLYNLFGRIMGMQAKHRMYIDKFIKPYPNMRILDIGCGTSAILDFLPMNIDYSGYDVNTDYIKYAKKKYGYRAVFYNQRVNDMTLNNSEPFDVVLADALLHHLNDCEAKNLFDIGYRALKNNGFMLTIDPTFIANQKPMDKFIAATDRGQHVRYPNEYKKIAQSTFPQINVHTVPGIGTFSLTGCILKCWKE